MSTNVLFSNYLNDFKDIVQHNGLVQEEMNIVCQLLCTVNLSNSFFYIFLRYFPILPKYLIFRQNNIPAFPEFWVCKFSLVMVVTLHFTRK